MVGWLDGFFDPTIQPSNFLTFPASLYRTIELPAFMQLLQQLKRGDLSALTGGQIDLEIPIRQSVFDVVAAEIVQQEERLDGLKLEPLADNRLAIHVETTLSLAIVKRRIQRTIHLALPVHSTPAEQPILSLPIVSGLGALEGFVMDLFEKQINQRTPPFVRYYQERIDINLQEAMAEQGQEKLLPNLKSIDLTTQPGQLLVKVQVRID